MWDNETVMMLAENAGITLYMTLVSTLMAYVFGLPAGIALVLHAPDGLKPNRIVYKILDFIVNVTRSVPFLILLILIIPLTRVIAGKSYGATATIVPLTFAAAPFIARLVESSVREVDPGVIEAALSMGANTWQIIWKVLLTEFQDYVQPNEVVEAGEFDANYFQHRPYLESFNEEKGTHLTAIGDIHYEPLGIYPGTESSLDNVPDGAEIAIPNDTTNEARALLLLADNGLITLKEGAGIEATVLDIADNPHNIKFTELEAAQISRVLPEVSFAVLNGNYALEAGLNAAKDALTIETSDSEAAKTYVNVIVVKESNEKNEGVKALVEVLKSDEIKKFIHEKYEGSVVPF